uniref:Uncharacterized protein n=1 Tax=Setaria digitata TaxID=48799 RepID=A0A915PMY0_9BILA
MMFTVTGTTFPSSSSAPSTSSSTAKCRAREEGIFDGNVDGTKELDKNIQNPVLTAVPPVDTTASSTTDSSGNFEGVGKSVHGIVASLIRAAEETRFQALDKPKSLNLNNKTLQQNQPSTAVLTATSTSRQQETGTQTSPYSLSRSSSFDWINESSAREQHNEELITSTESPETPEDPEYSSPNRVVESDTTDKEVEEMLRSTKMRDSLLEKRKIQSSKDIDDSIAMLLEYAEDLDVVSKRGLHYPVTSENLTGFASDIRNSGSVFSREIPTDISRNKILSRNRNELLRRFVSSAGTAGFVHGLAGPHSYVTKGSSQASMNSSIYDNVPCTIQQPTGLQGSSGTVAVSADVTPTSTKLNHEVVLSRGQEVVDNCGSPNGSTISQRDISISSGLADSESSPMTPGAPAMISLHRIGRCRKQQRNADKNGSQLAQIEIESSFEMGSNESEIRSPPPPSPRSNTEKRTVSMILASDLFAFSSGRVPERAESCEELDVDFSEQASDEVYTQKKQKAGECLLVFKFFPKICWSVAYF